MVSQPRERTCRNCSYSRLDKGAQCYCTLRCVIVPTNEMVLVQQCTVAIAAKKKAERLVAEAKAARQARQQEEAGGVQQPMRVCG